MSRVPGQTVQIGNARRRRQRIGLTLVSATAGALAIASPLAGVAPPSPPFTAEGAGAARKDVAPPSPPISATQVTAGVTNAVDVSATSLSDLGNLLKTAAPTLETSAGPPAPCTSLRGEPLDPSECGMKIKPQEHDPPPLTVLPNGNPVFNPDYLVEKIADQYGVSRSAVTTAAASTAGKCGVGMVWGTATAAVRAAFQDCLANGVQEALTPLADGAKLDTGSTVAANCAGSAESVKLQGKPVISVDGAIQCIKAIVGGATKPASPYTTDPQASPVPGLDDSPLLAENYAGALAQVIGVGCAAEAVTTGPAGCVKGGLIDGAGYVAGHNPGAVITGNQAQMIRLAQQLADKTNVNDDPAAKGLVAKLPQLIESVHYQDAVDLYAYNREGCELTPLVQAAPNKCAPSGIPTPGTRPAPVILSQAELNLAVRLLGDHYVNGQDPAPLVETLAASGVNMNGATGGPDFPRLRIPTESETTGTNSCGTGDFQKNVGYYGPSRACEIYLPPVVGRECLVNGTTYVVDCPKNPALQTALRKDPKITPWCGEQVGGASACEPPGDYYARRTDRGKLPSDIQLFDRLTSEQNAAAAAIAARTGQTGGVSPDDRAEAAATSSTSPGSGWKGQKDPATAEPVEPGTTSIPTTSTPSQPSTKRPPGSPDPAAGEPLDTPTVSVPTPSIPVPPKTVPGAVSPAAGEPVDSGTTSVPTPSTQASSGAGGASPDARDEAKPATVQSTPAPSSPSPRPAPTPAPRTPDPSAGEPTDSPAPQAPSPTPTPAPPTPSVPPPPAAPSGTGGASPDARDEAKPAPAGPTPTPPVSTPTQAPPPQTSPGTGGASPDARDEATPPPTPAPPVPTTPTPAPSPAPPKPSTPAPTPTPPKPTPSAPNPAAGEPKDPAPAAPKSTPTPAPQQPPVPVPSKPNPAPPNAPSPHPPPATPAPARPGGKAIPV